jgi:2-oxoisovalerate dehydrogenase E1 component
MIYNKDILSKIYSDFGILIDEALFIRYFELKLLDLYEEGRLTGTVHTCIGQELIPACLAKFSLEDDYWLSNHRGHGHYISKTKDSYGLIAEILSKDSGCSRGVGGSQHLFNNKFMSNGLQGGLLPIGNGIAYSNKFNNNKAIVLAYIGDGTLGEGIVYEALNLASLWNIPILYVLENNDYAQSTSTKQTIAGSIQKRIESFGIKYFNTSTEDIYNLYETCNQATEYVREMSLPGFIEINTFRLKAHSKGDDNRKDSVINFQNQNDLLNQLIHEKIVTLEEIKEKINKITNEALNAKDSEIFPEFKFITNTPIDLIAYKPLSGRINSNIYKSLNKLMYENSDMHIIGEDIEFLTEYTEKPYGGAFKVTSDLSEKFKGRVKNTPISESAIIGFGIGMALNRNKAIVEIMFGDFMTLAFDQILQQASKISSMFGIKIPIPLLIRTPMGGRRGYGPTHSQSLEKYFLGIPNVLILALNQRINFEDLYSNIFGKNSDITILFENKVGYTRFQEEGKLLGYQYNYSNEDFPTLVISPPEDESPVITVVCYGQILEEIEIASNILFEKHEILCEIICVTQIQPLNVYPIINSVKRTKNILIIEEGSGIASFNSIISSYILENNLKVKNFIKLSNDNIISASSKVENLQLVDSKKIVNEILKITF